MKVRVEKMKIKVDDLIEKLEEYKGKDIEGILVSKGDFQLLSYDIKEIKISEVYENNTEDLQIEFELDDILDIIV